MEKKEIKFCVSRHECEWGVELSDGRIIAVAGLDGKMLLDWETPLDLANGICYVGMRQCVEHVDGCVSLNELDSRGDVVGNVFCYDKWEIGLGEEVVMDDDLLCRVVNEFAEHGFRVSREAVLHNYEAWCLDLKSGYRDEDGGYHLFSACGCNPLCLCATTLFDGGKSWQVTYEC